MKVVVATTQVPFIRGGAEIHAENLLAALRQNGVEAEMVSIPFKWYPAPKILDHILACRLLDLEEANGEKIDRVIGLKFPAYLIPHPNKVLWILHQHRTAYDLKNHPQYADLIHQEHGSAVIGAIEEADRRYIPEARAVYANSRNVAGRLKHFCGIDSQPLYHPPGNAEAFYSADAEPYLYFPSRLNPLKRQSLVIEALAHTRQPVSVVFAGAADNPAYGDELKALAERLGVASRITWAGRVSEEEKLSLYARCLGVVYPPIDEDYGYITLEAMLAAKPVITTEDAGGPLEFVENGQTGLACSPTAQALAAAMDDMWSDKARAQRWGQEGKALYAARNVSWRNVVDTLLA